MWHGILERLNKTEKVFKNPHQPILSLIMSHQPAKFGGEWSRAVNVWKGLKVESTFKN